MKALLSALCVGTAVGFLASSPAYAQESGDFNNEFRAFRQQIDAAKEAAKSGNKENTADAGGVKEAETPASGEGAPTDAEKDILAADPLAALRAAAAGAPAKTPVNPLGPAANLPVAGQLPATAYAMAPQTPEEVQEKMEADLRAQRQKMKDLAFQQALDSLMPLSPAQVRVLLDRFRESRQSAETPMTVPEPRTRIETASLDPSAAPLVINIAPSHVTTVSLLDMTGSPWAIQDISWAGKVDIDTPEEGGHVLRLTPRTAHGVGNISLRLVDLVTPVTLRFQTGIEEVDYRLDIRIPRQGPLAKTPLIEYGGIRAVAGADENLAAVLEGAPAGEAVKMKVDGVDGRTTVWRIDETVYLRTPLTLLSPAWNESATSADGMNVYTLEDTPVILLSDEGRMVKAHIVPEGEF